MVLKPGERLVFSVQGQTECPENLGTPLDCGQVLRPMDAVNLVCGLQGDGGIPCPYRPRVIKDEGATRPKGSAQSHVSAETAGLPPLD